MKAILRVLLRPGTAMPRRCTLRLRDPLGESGVRVGLATLVAAFVSLIAAACGSGSTSGQLECEEKGYPCSLAEVPVEILERSNELGDKAVAMLEEGASTGDVEAWLAEQAEMAELGADDLVVRFRLEGGREHWIFTRDALATRSTRFAAAAPATDAARARRLAYVVGDDSEQKRALVLSPFQWDLKDAGDEVADVLSGTRGYEGGVTYLTNDSEGARNVDVGSFQGWGSYQVIHVESHGGVLCDPSPCTAGIAARALSDAESKAAKLGKLTVEGGSVGVSPLGRFLILTADFFRFQYQGGLDDTLVLFNSCKNYSSAATDLADALRGSTSVFLGWDGTISGQYADPVVAALYRELSEGYTAERAYSKSGGSSSTADGSRLVLGKRQAGGDLRIRDVVYLLDPESGQVLTPADQVAIEGEPRDGKPDAAPYLVQVDGMPAESAPDALVHVSVDGVEAEPRPVSSGAPKGKDTGQWLLRGAIPLPDDLEEDRRAIFRAWVELPSGGESDHQVEAMLTGVEGMGLVWRGEARHVKETVGGTETTVATLTFERKPSQDPKPKSAAYVLTEATITWSLGGRHYLCEFAGSSTRTWRIPPEQLDSTIGLAVNGSSIRNGHLVFDLTKDPVQYTGYVRFDAPGSIRVALTGCGPAINDHVRPYSPDPIFLSAGWPGPRERYTTPDRKTVSDRHAPTHTGVILSWEWRLTRVK